MLRALLGNEKTVVWKLDGDGDGDVNGLLRQIHLLARLYGIGRKEEVEIEM